MVTYKIQVRDNNGDVLGEFETFRNLKFGKRLNNYGTCSFDVPATSTKASSLVSLRKYQVFIYRIDGIVESLIWSGEQAMREGKLDEKKNNWVSIHSFTWFEQLNNRFTADEVTFTADDAGQIAWSLIETSQAQTNGDLGIIEGVIEPTVDRDRTFFNQNILEAIVNLANVISGFDFDISDEKIFNVWEVKGTDKSADVVFEYGSTITNAHIIEDFTDPASRAIVLGEATGETSLQRVERDDLASQANYGLREQRLTESDVSEIETLQDKGDAVLRKFAAPVLQIDVDILKSSVAISEFELGDLVRLIIKEGIYTIDDSYRIFEWEVSYNDDNSESLTLVMGLLNT